MADSPLFNPHTYDPAHFELETRRLLRATVDWFEARGRRRLIEDYRTRAWLGDFLAFSDEEGLFETFLTPSAEA
ncbi:acyl-CoA dehydrogenase, partial [Streptomyces sp. SR27]|nr:acyl-CoA dehydrogenase [Streptomyces sp. SR27]